MLDKFFQLDKNNTTLKREIIGGSTTFMTLSYIIFVQPAVLSATGMDAGAVMTATCLTSALAMVMMGLLANYPIALAPGMGHNFFFTYTVCLTMGVTWQEALGGVFIAGCFFMIISLFGIRETVMNAIPPAIRNAIPVGIGLLIALIGLEWGGIVAAHPATYVTLGDLGSPSVLLALFGILVTAALMALRIRGAILIGILLSTVAGLIFGVVKYQGIFAAPPSLAPTFFALRMPAIFSNPNIITIILIFIFLDLFDTVGTLVGVGQQAGLMQDGKLRNARMAFFSDAAATSAGALLGTSTVTSYIESAAGVEAGARTGLANIVTAALMMAALFFSPLIAMVSSPIASGEVTLYPVIAPALVLVGSLMIRNVVQIKWDDIAESIPAFFTMLIMPLTFSITEGISFGFISYAFIALVSGRGRKVHWLIYVFAGLFIARYIWLMA